MNRIPCFATEDVARVLASPPDDPRRAHARECPKCGALIAAFELYQTAEEHVPAAELDQATERLQAFVAREIGGAPAPARELRAPARPTPRFAWLQPALAFAAVALVAGVLLWPRPASNPAHVNLRGAPAGGAKLALGLARVEAGHFKAHWAAAAGADRYEVRFYAPDLSQLGSLASADTSLDLDARTLPFTPDPKSGVLVRVVALAEGRELSTSTPQELEVR